ncbi:MAG: L-fucose/L-arabinose isomerase family protein [Armatimonadota bacterium]
MRPTTFALYFGNRGFFPESLIAGARREMQDAVEGAGYGALLLDAAATRYGAVETTAEGQRYAQFLTEHRGEYDGVIICLPNFGDENGAVAALQDAGVPILIQAYPDALDKLDGNQRRDAFCGKFSIMDVFCQYGVPFTTFPPHTVHPAGETFAQHLHWFAATCRVVRRLRRLTVGAIGARTTAFKTIRFDELALQRYGVTTETFDLSELFQRVRAIDMASDAFQAKTARLQAYTQWDGVPDESFRQLAKVSVALDDMIAENGLDAIALRCWMEIQRELQITPCVLLSELNDRGIVASCELDVCNAVTMVALAEASGQAATCLDWNNNYGDEEDKCILFHCGPVPQSLMTGPGHVVDNALLAKALGPGCSFGCNVGRIAPTPMTFVSLKTQEGVLSYYLGEGDFTTDPISEEFFGCAGVAEIPNLQQALLTIGRQGYRHHVGVTAGQVAVPVREALTRYLGYTETTL